MVRQVMFRLYIKHIAKIFLYRPSVSNCEINQEILTFAANIIILINRTCTYYVDVI